MFKYIYIYIYIYKRERERERERALNMTKIAVHKAVEFLTLLYRLELLSPNQTCVAVEYVRANKCSGYDTDGEASVMRLLVMCRYKVNNNLIFLSMT